MNAEQQLADSDDLPPLTLVERVCSILRGEEVRSEALQAQRRLLEARAICATGSGAEARETNVDGTGGDRQTPFRRACRKSGSVLICLTGPFQRLPWKPLPSARNLLPSERLRYCLSMPSKKAEVNSVVSLYCEPNKSHRQRHLVERYRRVGGCIARKASSISGCNRQRRLENRPLHQPYKPIGFVIGEVLPALGASLELLLRHVAEELYVLQIEEPSRISYRYGKV